MPIASTMFSCCGWRRYMYKFCTNVRPFDKANSTALDSLISPIWTVTFTMKTILLFLSFVAAAAVHAHVEVNDKRDAQSSAYWYEAIKHDGTSPTITNGKSWIVYRNVKDYGAKGDGTTDDTSAIQRAI